MYFIINKLINSLIKKINIIRAEKCVIGYYPTTIHSKAFVYMVNMVVTPLWFLRLLPAYYPLLPLQGNYLKNTVNKLTYN